MKQLLLVSAFSFLIFPTLNSQVTQQWATPYNGPAGTGDEGKAIAIDASGNTYVTGRATNVGNYDYATLKYNSAGVQQWVSFRNGTANGNDIAKAICVDGAGNVYVTGRCQNTAVGNDIVTIKYNTSGTQQWIATYNGPANDEDEGVAIAVDASGNVYVTGTRTNASFNLDYITIKYNSAGAQQWAIPYDGGTENDLATDIDIDASGNVYVIGQSRNGAFDYDYGTVKYNSAGAQQWVRLFDSGSGDDVGTGVEVDGTGNVYVTGQSAAGSGNYATIKYDASGVLQWNTPYNGTGAGDDYALDLQLDPAGNIVVTGYSMNAAANYDYLTVKYNSSGVQQWATPLNGTGNSGDFALKLCTDASNNVYVIGYTTGAASYDYTTVKYNSAGTEQWRISYAGSNDDLGLGIAVDASNNVYVTGQSLVTGINYNYVTIKYNQAVPLTATQSQSNVTCNTLCNGSATVTASGGTAPYTYSWAPSGGNAATASSLCAGTYTCTITDNVGAQITRSFNITQPPAISIVPSQTNILCNGMCTGQASVTATGGTGIYYYSWAPSVGTGSLATGLCAGTYTCTVSSPAGCTAVQMFFITQATTISVTATQTNVLCNTTCTGAAAVNVSGGTPPYTYNWAPSGGTSSAATGLCTGPYSCTITDANNCSMTQSFTITSPTAMTATSSQTDVLCNGNSTGVATVTVSGGASPYTYLWSSGGTGATESGLAAGTYTCTITDNNSCTTTQTIAITEPNAFSPSSIETDVTCFGGNDGAIDITVTGGTLPYTFDWNSGLYSTEDISGLSAGNYNVVLTDANGCTLTGTMAVVQPSQIAHNGVVTDASGCTTNDGTIDLTTLGGTGPFTFVWSNAATTEDISGLNGGVYSVIITDSMNCTASATFTITEPGAPSVTYTEPIDTACGGSLPTPPFTLSGEFPAGGTWTGPGVSGNSFDASLANIGMNIIIYAYTDANGCSGSATDSIYVDLCMDVTGAIASKFNVYPNPSAGKLNIVTNGEFAMIVVVDALGQQVMSLVSNSTTTEVDLSKHTDGIYFVRVAQNGTFMTQRVIITK